MRCDGNRMRPYSFEGGVANCRSWFASTRSLGPLLATKEPDGPDGWRVAANRAGRDAHARRASSGRHTPMPTLVNCWSSADDVTPDELTEPLRSSGVITADT